MARARGDQAVLEVEAAPDLLAMEAVDDLARAGRSAHALHGRGHGLDDAFGAGPEECELVGPFDGA